MSLVGKVAIVTGSGRGIGKACALKLASEGAAVVIADIDYSRASGTAEEIVANQNKAIAVEVDIGVESEVEAMQKQAVHSFGRIDILVNNAGYFSNLKRKPFDQIDSDEWDEVLKVNLKGTWICTKAVFPEMRKRGKGKIVNISSGTFYKGTPFMAHYVASKAGIIGLTRVLARELGHYGINVNAIAPGFTLTEGTEELYGDDRDARASERAAARSLKRDELPRDLVGTVAFLSSEASDFITGQTIVVDGGESFN